MDEEKRLICGLVSRLLDYPENDVADLSARTEKTAAKILGGRSKECLSDFLSYLKKTPLITLQEEYTRTFDHNPDLCLNLTFHKWGDDKKRGDALVKLIKTYREAGFEMSCLELPDYLPMLLEFISVCPGETGDLLLAEYEDQLAVIGSRLRAVQSAYANVFEVLI